MCVCEIDLYPMYSLGLVFALGLKNQLLEDVVIARDDADGKILCQQVRILIPEVADATRGARASELSDIGKSLRASQVQTVRGKGKRCLTSQTRLPDHRRSFCSASHAASGPGRRWCACYQMWAGTGRVSWPCQVRRPRGVQRPRGRHLRMSCLRKSQTSSQVRWCAWSSRIRANAAILGA